MEAIQKLSIPRSKRDIQSFLGKANFVRRFIPNFFELVKHITVMLKKDAKIKWTDQERNSFEDIKKAIMEAPTLISPDYTKSFYISLLHPMTQWQLYYYRKMMRVLIIQLHSSTKP